MADVPTEYSDHRCSSLKLAPRDGLFAASPRILRCAPDRRRETRRRPTWPAAKLSNRACFMSAVRIAGNKLPEPSDGSQNFSNLAPRDGFEPPTNGLTVLYNGYSTS